MKKRGEDDIDDKELGVEDRHNLMNMITPNGSFEDGEMDQLAATLRNVSWALEIALPYILEAFPVLAGLWFIVQKGIPLILEMKHLAETTIKALISGIQAIGEAMHDWFQWMFGVHYTGEYEMDSSYINSIGTNLDQTSRRLQEISNEVASITRSLRYNSLSGSCYKSSLNKISGQIERDREKVSKLAQAATGSMQCASRADGNAAACYAT